MKFSGLIVLVSLILSTFYCKTTTQIQHKKTKQLKALILDGENSHGIWPKSTFMIKDYLEQTGLFTVDIARKKYNWIGPHHNKVEETNNIQELITIYPLIDNVDRIVVDSARFDPDFNPNFDNYDVVINNLGYKTSKWPEATKANFEQYIKNGGGLVVIHSANNAWNNWEAYNKMIGLGGWGGRNSKSGPYVYYNTNNEKVINTSKGQCGSHGPQHSYTLKTRAPKHPIMQGLPLRWLHAKDELYERLRGPAENITILATAYSNSKYHKNMTDRHEPLLMAITYGKGKIFHSALGHMDYSMECVGFITTLQRGAEWAATGRVTQNLPKDFPNENDVSIRKWQH